MASSSRQRNVEPVSRTVASEAMIEVAKYLLAPSRRDAIFTASPIAV